MKKFIYIGYISTLVLLFFYSYTQIDLSLTFSRIDFLRQLVKSFQYIGYFNRPLSTFIFVLLIVMLFNFYLGFIVMAITKQISKKILWKLIFATVIILLFSYNAFSYDLFNYMFDAKIITHYHQNPYIHKALDFPGDPMLSYMHWTHRVYPYGPIWLLLTVPLSFLGLNLFIPTFILFKLLMGLSFLGTVYFIGKILQKITPHNYIYGLIFFAINPLVLIESLISAHLDIVMLFFAISSFYYLIEQKYVKSYILLAVSIGIKFVTGALLPVYLVLTYLQIKKKKINIKIHLYAGLALMILTIYYAAQRTNFQPWYLLDALFIASLLSNKYYIFIPSVIISFFAIFNYAPFLYLGNWNPPVPQLISGMNYISYLISLIGIIAYYLFKKNAKRNNQKLKQR